MMIYIIVIAMAISAFLSVAALRSVGSRDADQLLLLMCETGQKNMDNYFKSVEQSVAMLSAYVESDLDGLDDEKLQAHLSRVVPIFDKVISKTNGVLTYYYRIDPSISQNAKGFWYVIYDEGIGYLSLRYQGHHQAGLVYLAQSRGQTRMDKAIHN